MTRTKVFFGVLAIFVVLAFIFYGRVLQMPVRNTTPLARTDYVCSDGIKFIATIEVKSEGGGHAELFLPDGRDLVLTQTLSASGARYANADESFVFWTKGLSAFIQESSTITHPDCAAE